MTNIEEAISSLESTGFRVKVPFGILPTDRFFVCKEELFTGFGEIPDACRVSSDRERCQWIYENSLDTIPSPGPYDVCYYSPSLACVVNAIHRRYTEKSLLLHGWQFPTFLHPDWDETLLLASLREAQVVSLSEWLAMPVRFRGHPDRRRSADEYYASPVENMAVPAALWIRTDLRKMYIVQDRPTELIRHGPFMEPSQKLCLRKYGLEVLGLLIDLVTSESNPLRRDACELIGLILHDANYIERATVSSVIDLLLSIVGDSTDAQCRIGAIQALGLIGQSASPAVPILRGLLQDADPDVASRAAESLGLIGPMASVAVPDMADLLRRGITDCSSRIVQALGRIRRMPDVAIPALIDVLQINFTDRVMIVPWAVRQLGGSVLAAIAALLECGDDRYQYRAVLLADSMGQEARSLAPMINRLCEAASPWLAQAACETLWHIRRPKGVARFQGSVA
jgi:hypothetical protein